MLVILEATLQGWTGPSSTTEKEKQDRTERMIRAAVDEHEAFSNMAFDIYAKGSYANDTNVRSDSDVDIVVECQECIYWQEHDPVAGGHPPSGSYDGDWTPQKLRFEVGQALRAKFGASAVTEGKAAWTVGTSTARVDADVVPCFTYQYYFEDGTYREGTKLFTTAGKQIENFPKLQLMHGRAKNARTNHFYKKSVRILKRLENKMTAEGVCDNVPSYLLECLVYNVPNEVFARSSWRGVMRGVLAHAYNDLIESEPTVQNDRFIEPNEAKYLFDISQKWTRDGVLKFVGEAWDYMDFDA